MKGLKRTANVHHDSIMHVLSLGVGLRPTNLLLLQVRQLQYELKM